MIFPPGRARLATKPGDRIADAHHDNRDVLVACLAARIARGPCDNNIDFETDKLGQQGRQPLEISLSVAYSMRIFFPST